MRDFEPAKMKRVPFTGIRRVLEKANKLEAEGRKIVHFEVGQPCLLYTSDFTAG